MVVKKLPADFSLYAVSAQKLVESEAFSKFYQALDLLQQVAADLRGPGITANPVAMRTEIAVTNAIESLRAIGFKVR
jgi:hypothetical protein